MIDPAQIASLDDAAALRLLSAVARPRLRAGDVETALTPEIGEALRDAFGASAGARPTEGDLAREALLVLAADPAMEAPLTALLDGPQAESFDAGVLEAVGLLVGALVVLQTHVRFERTPAGKWKVLIDKPTTSTKLLQPLVEKLLALLPPGGGRG
jgi:hypothetical protein